MQKLTNRAKRYIALQCVLSDEDADMDKPWLLRKDKALDSEKSRAFGELTDEI